MVEIFISYNRTDRPTAQAIAIELQRVGVDVWWDHDLLGGDDYRARIADVLTRSLVAAVIWSRHSIDSQWVVAEAAAARERKCLIPITLDDAPPPLDFRPLHTLDFKNWLPGDPLPDAFLKAVGDRLGRELSYNEVVERAGAFNRLARKATQSWYLDFESILFYLIGQGLACFLCTLPLAFLASGLDSGGLPFPSWVPYVFSAIVGVIVSALYMRPLLAVSRLAVAAPLIAAAAGISVVSYILGYALLAQLGQRMIILVGPATLLLLLVTAVAGQVKGR
jgi:TIR domain